MSSLLVYSDEPELGAAIEELVPGADHRPLRDGDDVPLGPASVVVRTAPSADPTVVVSTGAPAAGPTGELLVAALRATGLPARHDPDTTSPPVPTITLPERERRRMPALAAAVRRWARAQSDRGVVLAAPRSACAGVDRAVEVVELALERFGRPVHVRKQIVHNEHIVADLTARGAVFVDSVDEVPAGAVVVFSAHGVSPEVRSAAAERDLVTIDATCPLVAKVHSEARHHAANGRTIAYIGHAGHEESEGTLGEAPDSMHLVETVEDVDTLEVDDPERVAFLTQTTLATDEVDEIVTALRRRFPDAKGPRGDDICYATTNRQRAVRAVAERTDLVLVVGSRTSSNANRLVEVATRAGAPAVLIEDATELDPALLHDAARVGLTAAASTPEPLVERVLAALRSLGEIDVDEVRIAREDIEFTLPARLR